ncbi:hypothetical protein [Mycobacterium deserti]|uniref:Secreted protein n=1 Tax=Mycobacterium deserti TaxID=2978347 RepID=A0ABT2MHR2_9MYCO|nr:hypothetical protein [Mycobacterium deserti]MCT7661823.1 hypothetical protein [Mycobacterium deserti]
MTLLAAVAVATPLGPVLGAAGTAGADGVKDNSGGGTFAPFAQMLRRCDFSETDFNGPTGYARATAVIRSDGSTVSADIQIATAIPNIRYDVRLIQVPRPSSASCIGGDPGVAVGALNIDGAGAAATSLSAPIAPGATGAWVFISRPDRFSQNPAEFYTTDLIVKI